MNTKTEKLCPKCGIVKPMSEYYFEKSTGKYCFACKACKNKMSKAYYQLHKEERHAYYVAFREKYGW